MKIRYLDFLLICLVAVCMMGLYCKNYVFRQAAQPERSESASPADVSEEQKDTSAIDTGENTYASTFREVPDTWEEIIDDKHSIHAAISVPDILKEQGYREATGNIIHPTPQEVLPLLDHKYQLEISVDDGKFVQYSDGKGTYVNFDDWLSFFTKHSDYVLMAYRDVYNRDIYPIDVDLDTFTLKECDEKIIQICSAVGLDSEYLVIHRALDYQTMEKEAIYYEDLKALKPDYGWSEEDNCFHCSIYQLCNGVKIVPFYLLTAYSDILETSGHMCIIAKDGVLYMYFTEIYDIEYGQSYEQILPFEDIVERYRKYETMDMLDYNTDIEEIAFRVLPVPRQDGSVKMTPVWIFKGWWRYETEDTIGDEVIVINAVTGDRL